MKNKLTTIYNFKNNNCVVYVPAVELEAPLAVHQISVEISAGH